MDISVLNGHKHPPREREGNTFRCRSRLSDHHVKPSWLSPPQTYLVGGGLGWQLACSDLHLDASSCTFVFCFLRAAVASWHYRVHSDASRCRRKQASCQHGPLPLRYVCVGDSQEGLMRIHGLTADFCTGMCSRFGFFVGGKVCR